MPKYLKAGLVVAVAMVLVAAGIYVSMPSETDVVEWTHETGFAIHSSPTVSQDTVYVVGGLGTVFALDAGTGEVEWQFNTTKPETLPYSSAIVSDDTVYVGGQDGVVYGLNTSTGEQIWSFTTSDDSGIRSSPAVRGQTVYIGGWNQISALNATTGDLRWNRSGYVFSTPVIGNRTVYVENRKREDIEGGKLLALHAVTGDVVWNVSVPQSRFFAPAVTERTVYVPSYDNRLFALDRETGRQLWRFTTQAMATASPSSPVVRDNIVYFGSQDGSVYALEANSGEEIWNFTTEGKIFSSPTIAQDTLYIGSHDNRTYALNATTGELEWSYNIGSAVSTYASPAFANGTLYVVANDGYVYALNTTAAERAYEAGDEGLPGFGGAVAALAVLGARPWHGSAVDWLSSRVEEDGNLSRPALVSHGPLLRARAQAGAV